MSISGWYIIEFWDVITSEFKILNVIKGLVQNFDYRIENN